MIQPAAGRPAITIGSAPDGQTGHSETARIRAQGSGFLAVSGVGHDIAGGMLFAYPSAGRIRERRTGGLVRETAGMRTRVTASGKKHNGLVFAVALACWAARKMYPDGTADEEANWRFKESRDLRLGWCSCGAQRSNRRRAGTDVRGGPASGCWRPPRC